MTGYAMNGTVNENGIYTNSRPPYDEFRRVDLSAVEAVSGYHGKCGRGAILYLYSGNDVLVWEDPGEISLAVECVQASGSFEE